MSNLSSASSSTPTSPSLASPLSTLNDSVRSIFDEGHERAAGKFVALRQLVLDGLDRPVQFDANGQAIGAGQVGWDACELVAGTVMVLASPCDRLENLRALRFASKILGERPTVRIVSTVPSADIGAHFSVAKKAAIDGRVGQLTVLGVNLVDVGMLERRQAGEDPKYTSFEHTFVLGIGREGFRMWSAWGKGYESRLDDLAEPEGARLRSWDEAKEFLKNFKILTSAKGTWSEEINKAYDTLFNVDMFYICNRVDDPFPPVVPNYKAWVRIFDIEDVKTASLGKLKRYKLGPRLKKSCEERAAHSVVTNGIFHGDI